jgi:hypothetical protein
VADAYFQEQTGFCYASSIAALVKFEEDFDTSRSNATNVAKTTFWKHGLSVDPEMPLLLKLAGVPSTVAEWEIAVGLLPKMRQRSARKSRCGSFVELKESCLVASSSCRQLGGADEAESTGLGYGGPTGGW